MRSTKTKRSATSIAIALALVLVGLLLLASIVISWTLLGTESGTELSWRLLGDWNILIARTLHRTFGLVEIVFPALLILWGISIMSRVTVSRTILRSLGISLGVALGFLALASFWPSASTSLVGRTGLLILGKGQNVLGTLGMALLTTGAFLVVLLVSAEHQLVALVSALKRVFQYAWRAVYWFGSRLGESAASLYHALRPEPRPALSRSQRRTSRRKQTQEPSRKPSTRPEISLDLPESDKQPVRTETRERVEPTPIVGVSKTAAKPKIVTEKESPAFAKRKTTTKPSSTSYRLPPLNLLDEPSQESRVEEPELMEKSRTLEATLEEFGVSAKVVQVCPGPVITRYELQPAKGVKINKIASLVDDIALTMEATSIRILAPVPGKAAVGVEIPNEHPSIVRLKEILDSGAFNSVEGASPIALGKDVAGNPVSLALQEMPHLLVAGATGSGKSVCLNSVVAGFLFRSTPEDLRLLLIDPKRLELTRYQGLPHLLSPVISDAKEAALALRWLVGEMEERYVILSKATVRNIDAYNELARRDDSENGGATPLPLIVVVVDEFADLMLKAPQEVEAPVQRLAQMARAVGIHLVFATQRPSVDVITGVIKANFASRIAFRVMSQMDSRTVLDRRGAEKLLGNGDMLILPTGKPDPIRVHGPYISSGEISRLVKFWKDQGKPEYLFEPSAGDEQLSFLGEDDDDEMYEEAVRLVITHKQGSASLLQRRLKVGYARAGRLIDMMERDGIVGPHEGSKAREVLVDESYLEEDEL
jgi:S-DNA-T family DNA segregation ATPase FtsK/SpoIIIE